VATERPKTPAPETYVPAGGARHVVQNHESWESLARGLGIDPWDLIEYNFPGTKAVRAADQQRATRYVNWYLSQYVGCQVRTPRGNYAFSSGLRQGRGAFKGGVVFLPPSPD
jgi:hypothetical protein